MIYDELKRLSLPHIEAWHNDLLVHDKRMIEEHAAGTPFLHYTRATGTHLFMLIPPDEYPGKGEFVPFLFGTANREHILRETVNAIRSFVRRLDIGDGPQRLILHYDGVKLRSVDERQAVKIVEDYSRHIRHVWDQAGRNCDQPVWH